MKVECSLLLREPTAVLGMIESKVHQRGDKKKAEKRMDVERSRTEEAKDYH